MKEVPPIILDNKIVVGAIESLLAEAKKGGIVVLTYAATNSNGEGFTGQALVKGSPVVTHLGNIEIMKARFLLGVEL